MDKGHLLTPTTTAVFVETPHRVIITISVMLATLLQSLDATIANVALPRMQGTLSATQDQMAWVLTSYIVAAAITIMLTGWLAGQFGRRKIFLLSIIGFTVTSALCGTAETLAEIVIFRTLQGICGAALVPLSQAILFDINPPKNHARAMAIWGVGVTLGPILGPALGGWLTDNYNWRWVFYINVPVGILAFVGLYYFMPENKNAERSHFDFFGFITLSLGIAGLQLLLDRGQFKDWFYSKEIIAETIMAGLGFYWFIVHMCSAKKPFLNLDLFKDHNFITANILIFVVGVVLFATLALLPPLLENQMNYPVFTTGLVTAPRGFGAMLTMFLVGPLMAKFDARKIMALGLCLTAYSLWEITQFALTMDPRPVIISGIVQGLGIGLVYVPLSTVAFSTLLPAMRNEGTSFFNLLRNIGSSIGISVVEFLFVRNTQIMHATLAEHITPYDTHSIAMLANKVDTATGQGVALLNTMLTNQAALIAYIDDFHWMMVMTLLALPLLFLLKRPKRSESDSDMPGVVE